MERRKFLTNVLFTGSVLGVGISCGRKIQPTNTESVAPATPASSSTLSGRYPSWLKQMC